MNYLKFWSEFKKWALNVNEDELPYRLKTVIALIKRNPEISIVKLAGYLEVDALYLAKYLYNTYKEINETQDSVS